MRTLVDIPDDQINALAKIGEHRRLSRAALIRRAIAALIASESAPPSDEAFGVWGQGEDGLDYQNRLRAEW
jgi:hypothetical protein